MACAKCDSRRTIVSSRALKRTLPTSRRYLRRMVIDELARDTTIECGYPVEPKCQRQGTEHIKLINNLLLKRISLFI